MRTNRRFSAVPALGFAAALVAGHDWLSGIERSSAQADRGPETGGRGRSRGTDGRGPRGLPSRPRDERAAARHRTARPARGVVAGGGRQRLSPR